MSRLPFLFIITGMIGFVLFHSISLFSLSSWLSEGLRGPTGWFHVHLFVLGWATMLAMGAVYQLINVILQSQIYSTRMGYVHYVVFTIGLVGLLFGFHSGTVTWIATFATITFIGILLFTWNMAVTLFRASRWDAITMSAACSIFYLLLTAIIGMMMGLNFYFGWWSDIHQQLFGAHIWVGTIGWFGLLITGFSYKMLPMFYLSHNFSTRLQPIVMILWNASVVIGMLAFIINTNLWLLITAILLLMIAVILYNIHLLQIKKHRHKKNPGTGILWSMYGNQVFAFLVLLMALYAVCFAQNILTSKSVLIAGWVYLGGWVSFIILSYASKIVPFLWWTLKYGNRVGLPGIPVMSDLLNDRKAFVGLTAIAVATLILILGLLLNSNIIVSIGGTAYSLFSIGYISLIGLVFAK